MEQGRLVKAEAAADRAAEKVEWAETDRGPDPQVAAFVRNAEKSILTNKACLVTRLIVQSAVRR